MPFVVSEAARIRALSIARANLCSYLKENVASFCPFTTKLLIKSVREALKALEGHVENKNRLLRIAHTTNIWLTRSKRFKSLNRIIKLLNKRQRSEIRNCTTSVTLIEASLNQSPQDPIEMADYNLLPVEDSQDAHVSPLAIKLENLDDV